MRYVVVMLREHEGRWDWRYVIVTSVGSPLTVSDARTMSLFHGDRAAGWVVQDVVPPVAVDRV